MIAKNGPVQIENRWMLDEVDEGLVAEQLVLVDGGLLESPDPFEIALEADKMATIQNFLHMQTAVLEKEVSVGGCHSVAGELG